MLFQCINRDYKKSLIKEKKEEIKENIQELKNQVKAKESTQLA